MKLKKHISKILFYSILFNSVPFYSNAASNSNLSRYETLKGEFIDLEDTKSEDITEIEIFGNTVQDPDNLEDIQSVGELYVDEEGEPILDSQGREQYKIELESCNKNLLNLNNLNLLEKKGSGVYEATISNDTIKFVRSGGYGGGVVVSTTPIYLNGRLFISYLYAGSDTYHRQKLYLYQNINDSKESYVITNGGVDIPSGFYYVGFGVNDSSDVTITNIILSSSQTDYTPHQSNKTTILLPCQLMKVGDVYDRLYWDSEKGKYVVEKNIKNTVLNGVEDWKTGSNYTNTHLFYCVMDDVDDNITSQQIISDKFIGKPGNTYNDSEMIYSWTGSKIYVHILKSKLSSMTLQAFKEWVSQNNILIIYVSKTPQLIETNITTPIKLSVYKDKTYISTVNNSGVKPTLKITIDRIEQVSQEAVENAISSPTSNNIALARMFINMLPESLYKDQLQSKLNEIFSEDMVLDRLTATANLDVYIQSENILMMSLNTNTVTFEDYSGVEELEIKDAIGITINSSLPYQLNAYIVGDITNKEKDKTLDLDVLNIKDSGELEYKQFSSTNTKLTLLDNVEKGNNISHNIDLKLSGNKAHDADVYKTTIKFEAEQK